MVTVVLIFVGETIVLFIIPLPPPSRPLTLGFCQLARQPFHAWLPDRAVFLSQLIPSKVSFIYSDSSGSVSVAQEGSAVRLDVF